MVKPDVKHNYYADLELPINASIEDVRKAYRKLALQYHPDRNAGREDECVPKFQAIQHAHEVLGDASVKQKYDVDRRKAGLYPSTQPTGFTPRQPTPGNPYTATSAYPPPPWRTQPRTGQQRPPPAAGSAANAGGATGADRFSNFPRPSHPTAKKDGAQDRANVFQAWQNMNTAQKRQTHSNAQPNPPPRPQQTQQQPPQQTQPQAARQRPQAPQPPPRPTNNMPTEEQIRAGTKHRQPPPAPGLDGLNERQRQWQAFNQDGPSKPGINRSNTTRTPKRQGFNPNTPGSDERAAPSSGAGYVHRNKSADFGRPQHQYPPPPPGAPPTNHMPTSPLSPKFSPTNTRPGTDPTRPDRTQVPYNEANRKRTPYSSSIGEKTDFSGDHMRRFYSTRDTTKLGPEDAANVTRARSSSPPRREPGAEQARPKPFMMYSSSSAASSNSDMAQPSPANDSATDTQHAGSAQDPNFRVRPKKVPRAPSSRVNGTRSGPTSPKPPPGPSNVNGNGMPTEDMQQKSKPSMYANSSPFDQKAWMAATFGSFSTSRAKQSRSKVPSWAIPASVNPTLKRDKAREVESVSYTTAADRAYICAQPSERDAYIKFQALLHEAFDHVPQNLDMTLFNTLIARYRGGVSTGKPELDQVVARLLHEFPSVGATEASTSTGDTNADQVRPFRFTFPRAEDLFTSSTQKSRSVENINTKFSPDDWHGQFTGEPGYFAPPSKSPTRRPVSSRTASSQRRSATMDAPSVSTGAENGETAQRRPWGSDGTGRFAPNSAPAQQTQEPVSVGPPDAEAFDAMDIDDTPPAQRGTDQPQPAPEQQKEARLYSQPLSAWRQQQEAAQQQTRHRKNSSASRRAQRASASNGSTGAKLNTNLDDLRHVEPIARSAGSSVGGGGGGFSNLSSLGADLPFQSAASNSLPTEALQKLDLPEVPVAPELPRKWSKLSWHMYAEAFADYLKREHEFNKKMLSYFAVRVQSDDRLIGEGGGKPRGWLEASGVSSDGIGFDAYANDVAKDAAMREAWNIGCERHRQAVKTFGDSRERVKGLAQGGLLPE